MPRIHVPNALTTARLALTPVFVWLFSTADDSTATRWYAAGVFLVASLTDLVDGYIARRRNQVTTFGKITGVENEGLVVLPPWKRLTIFKIRAEQADIEKERLELEATPEHELEGATISVYQVGPRGFELVG